MADRQKETAVWICRGCQIGESLDIDALENIAVHDCGANTCKSHDSLCGDEAAQLRVKVTVSHIDESTFRIVAQAVESILVPYG